MTFPRAQHTLELLRDEAIGIVRPILTDGINAVREQLCDEGIFSALGFRVALDAFAAALRERWAWEINDPVLRQALGEALDTMVAAAAQPDRAPATKESNAMDSADVIARYSARFSLAAASSEPADGFAVTKAKVDPVDAARQALIDRAWAADTSPTPH